MSQKDIIASRKAAVDLIESVIDNKMSAEIAIEQWPDYADDETDLALHALMHFRDDSDIHDDDKQYETRVDQLKEIAQALTSDSSDISKETRSWLKPWRFW